jgi:hypothetical protein
LVAVYVFVSTSIEMASSTISDIRIFVRRRDLLPDVNGDIERSKFFRYEPSYLASPYKFCIYSNGCPEDVCLAIFVPAATSLIMVIRTFGSPATSTRLFGVTFS